MLDLCNFLWSFYVFLKYVVVFIRLARLPFTRRRVPVRWILRRIKMAASKRERNISLTENTSFDI
jgi:hypothetical protein